MKRFLIIGLVILLAGTALINGVISLQNKTIDSEEFTLGEMESFINIPDPSLEIFDRDGKRYNNEANIYVYNNATYDGLKFDVSADMLNGVYPSNVAIDLGNNGRDEVQVLRAWCRSMGKPVHDVRQQVQTRDNLRSISST